MPETRLQPASRKRKPHKLTLICAALAALAFGGCAAQAPAGASRSPEAVFEAGLSQARVIYIPEEHNQASYHRLQEQIIRSLHQRGESVTVGMEMIDVTQQADLDQYLEQEISWNEFSRRTGFDRGWGKTSPAYKRILAWCRKSGVPVIGLNAPQSVTRKLARNQKLTPAEALLIPSFPEPPGGFEKFKSAMAGHPGSGSLRRYYDAQRAWDATMAERILARLADHEGTMVVLLGQFHADPQTGVPWYVANNSTVNQVIVHPAD